MTCYCVHLDTLRIHGWRIRVYKPSTQIQIHKRNPTLSQKTLELGSLKLSLPSHSLERDQWKPHNVARLPPPLQPQTYTYTPCVPHTVSDREPGRLHHYGVSIRNDLDVYYSIISLLFIQLSGKHMKAKCSWCHYKANL